MPRQTTVAVTQTPTQLTDADVTNITFQNVSALHEIYVFATTGATAPSADLTGWLKYDPGQGERNVALADLFPGIASAARVWAMTRGGSVGVTVSHA